MNNEHKRLLNIIKKTQDDISIKGSDVLFISLSNKEGLWAKSDNLKNKTQTIKYLKNILKELEKVM